MKVVCILLLAALSFGCGGYGSGSMSNGAGTGQISQLNPSSASAEGAAFTLTVNGSGFANGDVVYWGTSPRATTFVNSGQLTAAISASDIANSGTVTVYVHSSVYNTSTVMFMIN